MIAGFLGSGKTTLILEIARHLTVTSKRVVIVENEVASTGIDGQYLRDEGLMVQELFGGCVCCTLSTGLVSTLRQVQDVYHPDWTILEPTGVAILDDLLATVRQYADVTGISVVTLVDGTRYEDYPAMLDQVLTSQIEAADIVAISKSDAVDQATLGRIAKRLRRQKPGARILPISNEDRMSLNRLLEELA